MDRTKQSCIDRALRWRDRTPFAFARLDRGGVEWAVVRRGNQPTASCLRIRDEGWKGNLDLAEVLVSGQACGTQSIDGGVNGTVFWGRIDRMGCLG